MTEIESIVLLNDSVIEVACYHLFKVTSFTTQTAL